MGPTLPDQHLERPTTSQLVEEGRALVEQCRHLRRQLAAVRLETRLLIDSIRSDRRIQSAVVDAVAF